MPFFAAGDWNLYFEHDGDGPDLVFLAGTATDHRARNPVLDELRRHFRVLSLDQRGVGRSGAPDVECDVADYAADVTRLIEHAGLTDFACFGASFGGMVAQVVAVAGNTGMRRLVLACTTSGGAGGRQLRLTPSEADDPFAAAIRLYEFANVVGADVIGGRGAVDPVELERVMYERFAHVDSEQAIKGLRRQLIARDRHDAWDLVPAIDVDTLVCGGLYDGLARPDDVLNLAGRIPRSRVQLFRGGHFFMMEDPAAMTVIVDFLRGNS